MDNDTSDSSVAAPELTRRGLLKASALTAAAGEQWKFTKPSSACEAGMPAPSSMARL